jgi:RNA polymerase sigma-70 factor (ECF subfamily)
LSNTLDGALERLYLECRQQFFTCALAITHRPDRAEDAIQEAFCRLFRLSRKPRRLKPYVFRAVRNAAVDQIRRSPTPSEPLDTFIFDPGAGPREAAADSEFRARVSQALLRLSEDERETIVEHLFAGLTFRDIARVRQAPLGTVVAWYRRGLKKLQKTLESHREEAGIETEETLPQGSLGQP